MAVVTGAGGGIGTAAAVALGRSRGRPRAYRPQRRETARRPPPRVERVGRNALVVEADVTDEAAVEAPRDAVIAKFGRADILFNNAGITSPKLLADMSLDEWRLIN